VKLAPQEVKLAEQLVANLAEPFHLEKYQDEYQERLKALIEARQNGEEIAAAPQPKRAAVIDIMSALKKSLAASGKSARGRTASRPGPVSAAMASVRRRAAHRKAS
jgi:DNA end-binding protein Ku